MRCIIANLMSLVLALLAPAANDAQSLGAPRPAGSGQEATQMAGVEVRF